ncbi:ABC transporter permease [Brevibacterium litoralis]|uniref:ABC transporter permease n=1 Tax=Brevibacterium litoralis TaxID=3138935 RepID=UPI0032ECD940
MSPRYLLLRLGQAVLVLFLAYSLAAILLQILPGDGVMARYADPALGLPAEQIAAIHASYGADLPWYLQYWNGLRGVLQGDLGYSVNSGAAVSTLVTEALPSTLQLALVGFLGAVVLAVAVAVLATYGGWTALRRVFDSVPSLFISVPVFWLGIILVQIFSFSLGWVDVVEPGPVESLILPGLTVAVPLSAPIAQILIQSINEVRTQPFVKVTQAKGATEGWILVNSVARNSLLPALTITGLVFGELVAGAVITETVYGRAGIGALTAQAVADRDNPVLLAVVVLATLGYVLVNLIVDLLYPVIDVRLRRTSRSASRTTAHEAPSTPDTTDLSPALQGAGGTPGTHAQGASAASDTTNPGGTR